MIWFNTTGRRVLALEILPLLSASSTYYLTVDLSLFIVLCPFE